LFHGTTWESVLAIFLHLLYSLVLCGLAGPILHLHVGFISRNELANEWKQHDYYVVRTDSGEVLPVGEISNDDDFNRNFDYFYYDPDKNPFDQGLENNCWAFWCTARWETGQLGEF